MLHFYGCTDNHTQCWDTDLLNTTGSGYLDVFWIVFCDSALWNHHLALELALPGTESLTEVDDSQIQSGQGEKKISHWITKSLRLEKISKVINSNHQPNTTMPAKPCPEVPHLNVFWTPPGMVTQPLPWAACSNAWPLFQKRSFS